MSEWDDPVVQRKVKADAAQAEASGVAPGAETPSDQLPGTGVPAADEVIQADGTPEPGSIRMKVASPHCGLQVGFTGPMLNADEFTVVSEQQAAELRNAAQVQGVEIIEEVTP